MSPYFILIRLMKTKVYFFKKLLMHKIIRTFIPLLNTAREDRTFHELSRQATSVFCEKLTTQLLLKKIGDQQVFITYFYYNWTVISISNKRKKAIVSALCYVFFSIGALFAGINLEFTWAMISLLLSFVCISYNMSVRAGISFVLSLVIVFGSLAVFFLWFLF